MTGAMYWHPDDDAPQPTTTVTVTTMAAGSIATWWYYGLINSDDIEEALRRMDLEALGNATRPIFGLLWEVE